MYKVFRHHRAAFVETLNQLLVSRDQFDEFMATPPEVLTDIQRAVRFYYMVRTSFGAKIDRPHFAIGATKPSRLNLPQVEQDVAAAHERLARVTIENRSFDKIITSTDRAGTFFYIDPPYWNCEDVYGKGIFCKDDFVRLRDLLAGIKGKFIMSINDAPEIRELFGGFKIVEVKTRYSLNKGNGSEVTELLIMNF